MDTAVDTMAMERDGTDRAAALRRGDPTEFERLVVDHRAALHRLLIRILGTPEDADEALQETFVRAWRARAGFRGEARPGTWLTRIAINVACSVRARRVVAGPLEHAGALSDPGPGPDERASLAAARRRVRNAVDHLPPRQREVVWLKVFDGRTHAEVADALGITPGAVKAHLHQAVRGLRRRMAGGAGAEEGSR